MAHEVQPPRPLAAAVAFLVTEAAEVENGGALVAEPLVQPPRPLGRMVERLTTSFPRRFLRVKRETVFM
jgi:hypothetical protein